MGEFNEAVGWLHTHKGTGTRTLEFQPKADLPYNRDHWTSQPVYLAHQVLRPTSEDATSLGCEALMDSAREKRRRAYSLIKQAEALEQVAYDTADYCGGGEP